MNEKEAFTVFFIYKLKGSCESMLIKKNIVIHGIVYHLLTTDFFKIAEKLCIIKRLNATGSSECIWTINNGPMGHTQSPDFSLKICKFAIFGKKVFFEYNNQILIKAFIFKRFFADTKHLYKLITTLFFPYLAFGANEQIIIYINHIRHFLQ